MKKKGKFATAMEDQTLIEQRNAALKELYASIIKASKSIGFVSRKNVISIILDQPAPRFYITPYVAYIYLTNYRKRGENCRKQEMIKDLKKNFNRLRHQYPNATVDWLYKMVVEQPAKSWYMTPQRVEEIIFNYSGRNGKKKK